MITGGDPSQARRRRVMPPGEWRYPALAAFGFAGIVLCSALVARGSWWFLAALVPAVAVPVLVLGRLGGRRSPPSSRLARAVVHWVPAWLWFAGLVPQLWPDDGPRGALYVVLVVVVFTLLTLLFAAFSARSGTPLGEDPPPAPRRPGDHLSWAQRREIARAVRAGAMLPAARDDDVRAVIDRMLRLWEVVAWVVAIAGVGAAVFVVIAAHRDGPVLVLAVSAVLAALTTSAMLRRVATVRSHLLRLDTLRPPASRARASTSSTPSTHE